MIHSRITGIYAMKEKCINDLIRQIGLHSDWNKRKLGLGGVRVTFLKVNFGFGPNAPWAR
jgi:hypothetical protein